jgi:hypothetical protein
MKKKQTKRIKKKAPKTRYAVNRKPMAELQKFNQWWKQGVPVTGHTESLLDEIAWAAWQAALPRVRK